MFKHTWVAALLASSLLVSSCELLNDGSLSLPQTTAPTSETSSEEQGDSHEQGDDAEMQGTLIEAESPFWSEYAPAPVPGMTWVYETWSTNKGTTRTGTMRMEVLQVAGDVVTYRFETAFEGQEPRSGEHQADLTRYRGYPETRDQALTHSGKGSVTVPAGTYAHAVKLVERNELDDTVIWVVKGIGRVMEEIKPSKESSPTIPGGMRLKQFIRP